LFDARAAEAIQLGEAPRHWPPVVDANEQWHILYPELAASVGRNQSLNEAIAELNQWIKSIDSS